MYCKGPLLHTMEEGAWFLADEINQPFTAAWPEAAVPAAGGPALRLPARQPQGRPCGAVLPRIFSTANSASFAGRSQLPEALRGRIWVAVPEFPSGELPSVIQRRFQW